MDIRNFFKPKNEGSSPSAGKSPAPVVKKRSRKRMLIDSDSDEEPIKTLKNKSPDSSSRNSSVKKKVANAPSKYREVDSTAVKSLFGTEPVKQVAALKRKNEKTVGEKELADVSSAFLEIDDDAWIQDVASPVKQVVCRKEGNEKVTTQKKSESDSPRKKRQCLAGSVVPLESTSSASTERDNSPLNSLSKKTSTVTTDHRMSPEQETPEVAKSVKHNALTSKSPNSLNTAVNGNGLPKNRIIENEMCNPRVTIPNKSPKLSQPRNPGSSTVASPRKKIEKTESELWVDKYKPTTLKQIIGQQGDKSNVRKLVHWLKNWYSNHSGNKKIPRPSPWAKDNDGAYFKAALLSGPPGVGKTTTAQLVCKELQMDTVEFNASDTRSKKLLNEQITELLGSQSISPFFTGGASTSKHHVLLMDEVDGMAGNEDRGGMQELISLIKNSKVPVICMCNDRNHPKIRSLVNYCFDLRFSKPRADQIKSAMMSICFKEGIKIKPDALNDIITSANQDIRLILNHLSMLAAKKDAQMMVTTKELKLGAWDVLRKIFSETERSTMSIHDKLDLFFHDYSIAPLFVHENYLNVVPHCPTSKGKKEKMNLFAKAASSLCHGDFVDQAIRSRNAWSLLPTQAMFSTLIPGETLQGHVGGMINFPAWLGKNSKKNKMDRLAQEIQSHTRLKASASKEAIRLDYGQVFRDTLLRPLSTNGNEGIPESLSIMKEYSFLREDIQSLNELSLWPGAKDPLASIDSKVKAAFTRAYNKNPILTPFSVSAAGVKKNKSGAGDELEFDDDGDEDIEDEDQDDPLADGMIKAKTKTAKSEKEAKKPAASGSSDRKPRGRGRGVKR